MTTLKLSLFKYIKLTTSQIYFKNNIRMMSSSMICHVKSIDHEEDMVISFKYSSELIKERQFNLKRRKDEEVGKVFARLINNINNCTKKKIKQKNKKKTDIEKVDSDQIDIESSCDASVNISVLIDGLVVSHEERNEHVWKEGAVLKIGDSLYHVLLNAPSIASIKLPKCLMAGYLIIPIIETQFCTPKQCKFKWFKQRLPNEKNMMKRERRNSKSSNSSEIDVEEDIPVPTHEHQDKMPIPDSELPGYGGWFEVHDGMLYETSIHDIGRQLKVTCIPSNGTQDGFKVESISSGVVEAGPGLCPFEIRHCFTNEVTQPGSLRVMTYNILADLYADSDYSRQVLHPYCPPYALAIDYRKQLIMKEILGYNGDLYCLQEVDSKIYKSDLEPVLSSRNFGSVFSEKAGQVVEGMACFFRLSKLQLVDTETVILADCLTQDKLFKSFYEVVKQNKQLEQRVLNLKTVLQCVLLANMEDDNSLLLVANTHLYFHPDADHIRLLQASVCIKFLERKIENLKQQMPNKTISIIFTGDFNSCPEFGIYKLFTTGSISSQSEDWKSNSDEVINDISIKHSLSLMSACGTPDYTNYTPGFHGCLDYIFFDSTSFKCTDVVPLPSHEDVIKYTGLPNIVFPSDHIALVTTLEWIRSI